MGRLWGGYGEAMGSYVCINVTYRLVMGWLLGGYEEAMGRPWRGYVKLWGSLKGKAIILRIVNLLSWRVNYGENPCRHGSNPCRTHVGMLWAGFKGKATILRIVNLLS